MLLGARGFIAAALRAQLDAHAIRTVAVPSAEVDLTRSQAVDQLCARIEPDDAVVMLAALTPDKGRDSATMLSNLAMMHHVCAALRKTGCGHLVYVSSDAVYDPTVSLVNEAAPAAPQDLYGAMHRAREVMAAGANAERVLLVRPSAVYGTGDTHNAYGPNRFRRSAEKEGKILLFGGGEEMRDHIHVDDVARLIRLCLAHGSYGILNLVTGRSTSFRRVAELVASQGAGKVEITCAPRASEIRHRHYDVTNLIKAFPGFRFTSLEDGLARAGVISR